METLGKDIRYGLRMLLKAPSVSIVATIALALGIGANTAIFSVINAVLLRPLPFSNSEQLMAVWESDQTRGVLRGSYSYPNFMDLREPNHSFDQVASYHQSDFIMTGRGEPARLQGEVVTANLFQVLGVAPILGRTFLPNEDKPGDAGLVVVLSQALFQRRFNSDASVLNQSVILDGKSYTIVGVMPGSFEFPIQNEPVQLWTTIAGDATGNEPITTQRGAHFLHAIGRLKNGVSQQQAQVEVNTIAARLEQQYPDTNTHHGIKLEPALLALVGDIRPALLILLGGVACVLLIACANVANLLLARATARQREIATRSALGASRFRLIRQLLCESLLIASLGAAAGVFLAAAAVRVLRAAAPADFPRIVEATVDLRVLAFSVAAALATGVLFGLAPALSATRPVPRFARSGP